MLLCSPSTNTTAATNTTSDDNSRHNSVSNEEAAPTPPPETSNPAPTTSDTNADSTHDDGRPPDYQEALAYRKIEKQEAEGYPEPSLVDGPQPPSYDAVY